MIRAALAFCLTLCTPQWADAACRQALALGLDVSGSVDAREYRLQLGGLANALNDPRVRQALLTLPEHTIDLLVYEWSGLEDQAVILPWTTLSDAEVLDDTIARLHSTQRRQTSPGTALGAAMQLGAEYLAERPDCQKHTLDISGDGISNFGPRPRDLRVGLAADPPGLTINGLVIGVDDPAADDSQQAAIGTLAAYYRAEVMLGPNAFVQTALGFEDYGRAMAEKLLRELDGTAFSQLAHPTRTDQ